MIQKFLIAIIILLSSTLDISNEVIEDMRVSDTATYVIENLETLNQNQDEQGFDISLSFATSFHHEIDNNRPLLWCTSTNTYGSHTMAVAGYEKWSKTTGWWIFTSTEYLTFAELRDGHSTSPRYFDFNAYIGLAAFVRFDL